jgi:hypothetical protein
MMALRTACVNPSTLQPYIKSLTGGKDNSPEELQVSLEYHKRLAHEGDDMLTDGVPQHGATHGFVSGPVGLSPGSSA